MRVEVAPLMAMQSTAKHVGPVTLPDMPMYDDLPHIRSLIPHFCAWSSADTAELRLLPHEAEAFGVANSDSKHWLNVESIAPCALHAWGNQLSGCPGGCRQHSLSSTRIAEKGLHGIVLRCSDDDTGCSARHPHPREVAAFNVLDPASNGVAHSNSCCVPLASLRARCTLRG